MEEENLQFEIHAPADDADGGAAAAAQADSDKFNEFNDFVYRYFLQRFKHLNLSRSGDSIFSADRTCAFPVFFFPQSLFVSMCVKSVVSILRVR